RPRMPLRDDRSVQHLYDRQISGLRNLRLLQLLRQQCDDGFLDLHITCQSSQLQADLRNLREGHCEVPPVTTFRTKRWQLKDAVAILHLGQLALHFRNLPMQRDDFRVRIGREIAHHLELNLRRQDLTFETSRGLDRTAGLLLEDDGSVTLLEPAE